MITVMTIIDVSHKFCRVIYLMCTNIKSLNKTLFTNIRNKHSQCGQYDKRKKQKRRFVLRLCQIPPQSLG